MLHDFIEASSYGERFDHGSHDVLFSLLAGCCYRGLRSGFISRVIGKTDMDGVGRRFISWS